MWVFILQRLRHVNQERNTYTHSIYMYVFRYFESNIFQFRGIFSSLHYDWALCLWKWKGCSVFSVSFTANYKCIFKVSRTRVLLYLAETPCREVSEPCPPSSGKENSWYNSAFHALQINASTSFPFIINSLGTNVFLYIHAVAFSPSENKETET